MNTSLNTSISLLLFVCVGGDVRLSVVLVVVVLKHLHHFLSVNQLFFVKTRQRMVSWALRYLHTYTENCLF